MLTVRGIYDGKTFKVLSAESLPEVNREIPVAIVFLEDILTTPEMHQRQIEIAKQMRAARNTMKPLGMSVKELIEEGRER